MSAPKRRLKKLELDRVDLVGSPANPGAYIMLMKSASEVPVVKIDEAKRRVYGFASISTLKGQELVDSQGDVISPADLEDAAALFRGTAGVNHQGDPVGDVFESVYIDAQKADAMGLQGADGFAGWWIGVQLPEGPVWEMAKAGHLPAFSIQGRAQVEDIGKRQFTSGQRQNAADAGMAMPDGSFPIKTKADLMNAMQSLGRANNRAAVIAHIKRRAAAMGMTDMLNPDIYKSEGDIVDEEIQSDEAAEPNADEGGIVAAEIIETVALTADESVAKADFDAVRKSLEDAQAEITKMKRDAKVAEYIAKAKEFGNLGKADELGGLLLTANEHFTAEQYQELERLLKAANAQIESGDLFTQMSKDDAVEDLDVAGRVDVLAKAKVDAGTAKTMQIAKLQVLQENRELAAEYSHATRVS